MTDTCDVSTATQVVWQHAHGNEWKQGYKNFCIHIQIYDVDCIQAFSAAVSDTSGACVVSRLVEMQAHARLSSSAHTFPSSTATQLLVVPRSIPMTSLSE